ncbi:MAG: hypothetical protein ABIP51_23755 [Bacteroidia bacterium]
MILKVIPPAPKENDIIYTVDFALFPTRVEEYVIWLEYYQEQWQFIIKERPISMGLLMPVIPVKTGQWELISKTRL